MPHTDYTEAFESLTDGANITSSNTIFDAVVFNNTNVATSGGNSALTGSATAAVAGTMGAHLSSTGSSLTYLGKSVTGGAVGYASFTVKNYPGTPSAQTELLRLTSGSAQGTAIASLKITVGGKVAIFDATATLVSASSSASVLPAGEYRFELMAQPGTTTSNGIIGYKVYATDGSVWASYTSTASVNAGTVNVAGARFNAPLSSSGWSSGINIDIATLRISDNTSDWVGWVNASAPPTASVATSNPVAFIDARGSVPGDSSSLTYAIVTKSGPSGWASPTAVSGLAGVWTVPLPAASDGVVTVTVTQTGDSQTASTDVTIAHATGGSSAAIVRLVWDGTNWT